LNEETPHEGLQRFIEAHVEAEIEQAVGRLRSHLRPKDQLTFIFIGDYDLSFLGMPVERIEAFQICREAGTPAQITRWKILEAVRQLRKQSKKITQAAIASLASVSQPAIAKIATQFGGWKSLKKILLALLDPFNSGSNNFSGLTEEERWLAQTYIPMCLSDPPEEAIEQLGSIVQVYGMKGFLRFLCACDAKAQAKLLALMLRAFGADIANELLISTRQKDPC
jgi:hypothetical protein